MNYIFLDEIQHVDAYEKAVDSLFLRENCDVYITGSNAWFMSGELATLLTGRYAELSMMPLSFAEFCDGLDEERKSLPLNEKFTQYMETGSFPYVLKYQYGPAEAREYMDGIYHTILLNDVVKRLKISDVNMLESVTRYLMHNIGNRTTPSTIANTMVSRQRKIDPKTVDRYLRGLTDSLLFYEARRYNIKGKELLSSISKYYVCDIAMRNMLVRGRDSDIGHILETSYIWSCAAEAMTSSWGSTAQTERSTLSPSETDSRSITRSRRLPWKTGCSSASWPPLGKSRIITRNTCSLSMSSSER